MLAEDFTKENRFFNKGLKPNIQIFAEKEEIKQIPERVPGFGVNNMKEFFESNFGKQLKQKVTKTSQRYQGQPIYEVTDKFEKYGLKKGYRFYLDGLHKDHIEVFNSKGKAKMVLNLDGSVNKIKTDIALKANRKI